MGFVRFLLKLLVVLGLLIGVGLFAARFADGPLEIVAGGPFKTGEQYNGAEPDWQFLEDTNTIEFQLLEPARSRVTWVAHHDGRVFIPSGYMTTWWGKIWKQWPHEVVKDGRILLRVDGTIYERRLERVTDGPWVQPVLAQLSQKYLDGAEIPPEALTSGYMWIFEVLPR